MFSVTGKCLPRFYSLYANKAEKEIESSVLSEWEPRTKETVIKPIEFDKSTSSNVNCFGVFYAQHL